MPRLQPGHAVELTGLPGAGKALFLLTLTQTLSHHRSSTPSPLSTTLLIVTANEAEMEGLCEDLSALATTCQTWFLARSASGTLPRTLPRILLFPEYPPMDRLTSLGALAQQLPTITVTTPQALAKGTLTPQDLTQRALWLKPGTGYPRTRLLHTLAVAGYHRTDFVEGEGEMAVRGEVIDLWPPDQPQPLRLLFNGDTLESIKPFDVGSQRTERFLDEHWLLPASEEPRTGHVTDFLSPQTVWFLDDLESDLAPHNPWGVIGYRAVASAPPALDAACRTPPSFPPGDHRRDLLQETLSQWHAAGWRMLILCPTSAERERLLDRLEEDLPAALRRAIELLIGRLRHGVVIPALKLAILTQEEILGHPRRAPRRLPFREAGQALAGLWDIRTGDFVVHEQFGIGRFRGLQRLTSGGQEAEYLAIEYQGGDKLFVPTHDFRHVQKYIGAEGKRPRLHKLDTATWEHIKQRAREGVQALAKELLRLYATRQHVAGYAYPPDSPAERDFAAAFLFEETPDQAKAIADVHKDLTSPRPMDRLVLGDVGYGKTEVAMRAALKTALSGKQVAMLVPTTILAEQHFQTFQERFRDLPITLALLSRFQPRLTQQTTIAGVQRGVVDIVIGTHRLFQRDVRFKDLGLVIIDEEHRFGVRHKERLKQLKTTVDALTLSATPIPRTLSLALSGLRDISVIETPPVGRLPIVTHVGPFDEALVQQAVQQEIARGGQVFYVHNRIETLDSRRRSLEQLLPGLSIGVVHGKMRGPAIEAVMWKFLHQQSRLLLATTIIESGLDIPTVNTLIVEEAEELGLAQLYQLRGRVGRERQRAYCYLFFSPTGGLTAQAKQRLEALREFTELGSGFRLALRDLEIRGAGNLLGAEQHGVVAAVGFDLYCQLLHTEVQRLKGGPIETPQEGPVLDLAIPAYFPEDYMPGEDTRILFYKQVTSIQRPEEITAMAQELTDRFGPPPTPAANLLSLVQLRLLAQTLGLASIVQKPSGLELTFQEPPTLDPQTLVAAVQRDSQGIELLPGRSPENPLRLRIASARFATPGPMPFLESWLSRLAQGK